MAKANKSTSTSRRRTRQAMQNKVEGVLTRNEKDKLLKQTLNQMLQNSYIFRQEAIRRLLTSDKRDIDNECGYPPSPITIDEYKAMFERNGLANRVVRIFPEECWNVVPAVYENEEKKSSQFEEAWDEVTQRVRVFTYLNRIDMLSGIGRFGLLLLGIDDGEGYEKPVKGIDLKTGKATGKNKHQLLYLKAFDESCVKIKTKETDTKNPRYGLPVLYDITMVDESSIEVSTSRTLTIHWTRVIHIADNRQMSDVLGTPRMEPVYNRLLDCKKILGGSGEMFWKGGFFGTSLELLPNKEGIYPELTSTVKTEIKEELEEFYAGLKRYAVLQGMEMKDHPPQVADPSKHLEANLKFIAMTLGVPYRVFLGTEEAKLASTQDKTTWNGRVARRQNDYLTPLVVRPFVDRLIAFGTLPEPKEYFVEWPDLNAPSDNDKADVMLKKTEAFAKYVGGDVQVLIPPKEFLTIVAEMSEEEVTTIEEAAEDYQKELDEIRKQEQEDMEKQNQDNQNQNELDEQE